MSGSHAYYSGDPPGLAGAYHYGLGGLGVLGSEIPSSGEHGPGYLYPSLNLPADADKEYYGVLGAIPAGLSPFEVDEYSRVTAAASNGSYRVPFTLYENGTLLGATYFDLNFGVVGNVISLAAASCAQANASSVGIANISAGSKVITLSGTTCSQANSGGGGFVGVMIFTPPGDIDATLAAAANTVIFEGGSRVVDFSQTYSTPEGYMANQPYRENGRWYMDKDPDDQRIYVGNVTQDLIDSNTSVLSFEAIPVGVAVMEKGSPQGVRGGLLPVKLDGFGPEEGEPHCTLRVTCANGERFDRSFWFKKVDN